MKSRILGVTTPVQNDYDVFRKFLEDACGIVLGDNKQYLVKSRLKRVLEQHTLTDLGALVIELKKTHRGALRDQVIDAMTTNETLWFRDNHPYRILNDILLPEFSAKNNISPVKVWSAACSTGQEPYSILMVADEFQSRNLAKLKGGVRVTATDISPTVLDVAKTGIYESLALGRGLSPERLKKYFDQESDSRWQIKSRFRNMVNFRSLNLRDNFSLLGGKFDVIFCRNVLIYFSADLKLDILSRMHQMLNPGGYLILGASESLNGLNGKYEMVQCNPGIIYRAR